MPETRDHLASPTALPPEAAAGTAAAPRRTLAMRLAERNGQRELRAARLARLRTPGEPARAVDRAVDRVPGSEAVLEVYLPAGPALPEVARAPAPLPGPVARAAGPDELAGLPGVGPGLAAALRRAGVAGFADLAGLDPAALAARLGPIGRLVPAARWIAAARAAAMTEAAVPVPEPVSAR